jgi:hypothetical protein
VTFGAVTVVQDTAALPVQLAGFSALAIAGSGVELTWRTASELNNYGFEVEKARGNPEDFELIPGSFVAGHGTTIEPQAYTYTDVAAGPGIWYYRLRQIDLDGTVTVHDPVQVSVEITTSVPSEELPGSVALEQNYPNPFNPTTTITFHLPERRTVLLALYDMLGREIARLAEGEYAAGTHRVVLDASALAAGTYVYRLVAGPFSASRRLLLVK